MRKLSIDPPAQRGPRRTKGRGMTFKFRQDNNDYLHAESIRQNRSMTSILERLIDESRKYK